MEPKSSGGTAIGILEVFKTLNLDAARTRRLKKILAAPPFQTLLRHIPSQAERSALNAAALSLVSNYVQAMNLKQLGYGDGRFLQFRAREDEFVSKVESARTPYI